MLALPVARPEHTEVLPVFRRIHVALVSALVTTTVVASPITLPPSVAGVEGDFFANRPLAPVAQTTQFLYGDSHLGGLPVGSTITGMRFRLDGAQPTGPAGTITFADYSVVMSRSVFAPDSLSLTFADNIGPDAVTVMSGPLEIAAGAFPGGGSPNPFGPTFVFDTPYTYTGGDLLLTIRHTGNGSEIVPIDFQSGVGLKNAIADGANATTASNILSGAIVVEFDYLRPTETAVPEPASLVVFALGLAAVGVARRFRRRS